MHFEPCGGLFLISNLAARRFQPLISHQVRPFRIINRITRPIMTEQQNDIDKQIQELTEKLKNQGIKIRELKSSNAEPSIVEEAVGSMKSIKDQLGLLKVKAGRAPANTSKKQNITVKTPKGTVDYTPADMALREKIFNTITKVFKSHGAVTIDTPVFELKEILQGKYGEDSKLIYDLEDQGGEKCSLRYDLTVPFARYLALNTDCKAPMKRYHIAKVYRRDQPAMTKGRMREFYQCDYDISGSFEPMIPDSEVLRVMCEVLKNLEVGEFTVKVNHRMLLDGLFEVCGVPEQKFRTICSAVDKLDKLPWQEVKNEMVSEKGLDPQVADKIGSFVKLNGGKKLIEQLLDNPELSKNERSKRGLEDLRLLFTYLDIFQITPRISFDLSLARGLDYYTGVIYEAVLNHIDVPSSKQDEGVGVGSIAGGGRYDNLVGMFAQKNVQIPCVGFSIGVERIYSILKHKMAKTKQSLRHVATDVYVISIDGLLEERMKICSELWDAGISADFSYKSKPKLVKQFDHCNKDDNQIPWAVIIGSDEVAQGMVRIKNMMDKVEDPKLKMGELVERKKLIPELIKRINSF